MFEFQICFEAALNTVKAHFHAGKRSTERKFFQLKQKTSISRITAFAKFSIGKNGTKIKEIFQLFRNSTGKKHAYFLTNQTLLFCRVTK